MDFRPMEERELAGWYAEGLCAAFIPQECKPLADILRLRAEGRYELWGLYDGAAQIGFACLWKAPDVPLVLLDYLGVTAARRSGGLGSRILAALRAQGRPLVTEAELPVAGDAEEESSLRRRRIGFYTRNGFAPAYRMATCGMAWQALLCDPTGAAAADVMRWHRALYGDARTDVRVPLPDGETPAPPYWMK